jgi:hypothetical protein
MPGRQETAVASPHRRDRDGGPHRSVPGGFRVGDGQAREPLSLVRGEPGRRSTGRVRAGRRGRVGASASGDEPSGD